MMQHSNYNRWTWLIAILLIAILVILWLLGYGGNQSCCSNHDSAAAVTETSVVAENAIPFHFSANAQTIDITGNQSQAPWLSKSDAIKALLANGKDLTLTGDASNAILSGEVDTAAIKEQKGLELQQALGETVAIDNQLTVNALLESAVTPLNAPPPNVVKIYFSTAQATLAEKDIAGLQTTIDWLKNNPNAKATIAGYHDSKGLPENNVKIAKSRAQAVYDAIVAAGIPSNQLELSQQDNMLGNGSYEEARRAEVSVK